MKLRPVLLALAATGCVQHPLPELVPLPTLDIQAGVHSASFNPRFEDLVVASDGTAKYASTRHQLGMAPESTERRFSLRRDQMEALDRAIAEANFFSIPEMTGWVAYSSSFRTLKIKRNGIEHEVLIFPTFGEPIREKDRADQLERAERVWKAVWALGDGFH